MDARRGVTVPLTGPTTSASASASGWRRLLVEPARPKRIASRNDAYWFAVATVCVGAFMGQLDASIVTLAFPTLTRDFHASVADVQWVGLAYLLALAIALPLVGRLADMVGRKLLYTYGFILFIIGSALCGLSGSLVMLDIFRVLQAMGAAMLQANSVAIIAGVMPPEKLGSGIGVQGMAQALGLALGPVVGGLLITLGGWRLIFYVNVPAGIVGTMLGWYLIPRSRNLSGTARFDWTGSAMLLPAVGALFYALSEGSTFGWGSPVILACFVIAIASFAVFLRVEARAAAPILRLGLLRLRSFTNGLGQGVTNYMVTFGTLFVVPFFLESARHASPATAGLELLAMPAGLGIVALFAGRWADQVGPRRPAVIGMSVDVVCLAYLALFRPSGIPFLVALALVGAGVGASTAPNNAATVGAVPREHQGVASGVLNMIRSFGTAMGLSITASVFTAVAGSAVDPTLVAGGFSAAVWMLAGVAFVGGVLAVLRGNVKLSADPTLRVE